MEVKQMNDSFFCENEGHYFFYDASTGFMSETSRVFNDVISAYRKYNNIEDAKKELSLTYNFSQIDGILDEVVQLKERGIIFNNRKIPVIRCADIQEEEWDKGNVLENLILNISHECNMRCKYCFADHGHFQSKAALMSKKIAKDSIDYWFGHLDKSRKRTSITFFGGEPLLNKEVFLYSLEYIESLLEGTGVIPTYAITTNGTLINDELIQIFLKYRMQPDISVDGGMYVQNKNRPLRTGNGSYNMVVESAKKLRNYYDRLVAKITLIHEDVDKLKQSVCDLWDAGFTDVVYIFALTNDEKMTIAYQDITELRKQLFDLADLMYENLIYGRPGRIINFIDIGYRLHNNFVKNECSFLNPFTIHVTPEGEIYKCGKMVGMKDFCMGDIYSGVQWQKLIAKPKKYLMDNAECRFCWAKRICSGGCAYANQIYNRDIDVTNPLVCEEKKVQIEAAIYLYTKLYLNNKDIFAKLYNEPLKGPCIKER